MFSNRFLLIEYGSDALISEAWFQRDLSRCAVQLLRYAVHTDAADKTLMSVFRIKQPEIRGLFPPGQDSWVSGAHERRLPAARCKCGGGPSRAGWGDPALAYPHLAIPAQ